MKIAICQIDPIIADLEYNKRLIKDASAKARAAGCDLAIFPEMSIIGYPPKDLLEKPAFVRANIDCLYELAKELPDIPVVCGYVDRNSKPTGKPLINSSALLAGGEVLEKGGKRLLPTYDVFDETRYFESATQSLLFDLKGVRFGVTICEDIWNLGEVPGIPRYELDPVLEIVKSYNVQILVNISASPFTVDKAGVRLHILQELVRTHGIPAIYCNQVGGNDDLLFDGYSMVVDVRGNLIRLARPFQPDILIWDTERTYDPIIDPWPSQEKTIHDALVMGTRDYAFKCGFKRVLVGLSGGIDSSLVACIAKEAMGAENVLGVSMPSPYTSSMSREDAKKLSQNLGIRFEEIPIAELFATYKKVLAPLFKNLPEDETEENIQARIRGNLLMALSNKFKSLLLTTGNKSEFAMGYCTLYGDLSGGLAIISDLPKTWCYRLAKYINREREIIPQRVITRPPSAELKPDQTDQDTLPPYEILDQILEAAVEKNMGYEEIVALGHDPSIVRDVLRRLVLNEYKRRQAPPGLKVTSKAFGYGRRYPIARGRRAY
ncbi:MAG: NAD+ synthase [Deltaproteobacteria bacterium]|nr:NAD+ synthase [Deltaproteobacteria bacterium]MBW2025068.1 NAD+ synthase [Deltaproteobacteria bacterium]MBW2125102.1 NAD+ synthase [Deltaproteobacteria bacterium]